jgi:hypothetical protein
MINKENRKGAILAAAAAALFVASPAAVYAGAHSEAEPTGHCVGANSCKGTSAGTECMQRPGMDGNDQG